jgi:hypothetical protein
MSKFLSNDIGIRFKKYSFRHSIPIKGMKFGKSYCWPMYDYMKGT